MEEIRQGWTCPICNTGLAPWVETCSHSYPPVTPYYPLPYNPWIKYPNTPTYPLYPIIYGYNADSTNTQVTHG